ncbi:dihydrofolate reductase [Pyxidicoccus fallax]|uniref:Dihydrofolate reductase n=1 Tax=Pyxidicoccus fallax TaxID=394095 RepID=A0A848LMJ2_9BACT|nr:dihydrofolate reductase family protein [Pyxidicoccus fallax]NMO18956.1 dihydrofolate reductase [Pyxidicoccus fallax]NPC79455.1 dihydrofolate reductase [Pyxidicoccus fallax]
MRKLSVFNNVSLDGYFVDASGDMSWAHKQDAEWNAFTSENASGGGALVLGRVTYDMMAGFWPTPAAHALMPDVAEGMNRMPKVVFSRTLERASWENTRLVKGDLVSEMRKLKAEPGPDMVILGSGSIVAQLTEARLVDDYQLAVHPLVLGSGRTLFQGVQRRLELTLKQTRAFSNGCVMLWYQPAS